MFFFISVFISNLIIFYILQQCSDKQFKVRPILLQSTFKELLTFASSSQKIALVEEALACLNSQLKGVSRDIRHKLREDNMEAL